MTSNKKKQLFTQIYNNNAQSILRLCFMYLKNNELAQDATQETFLKAYKRLSSFKSLSKVNTWLTSIAINTCKNYIRNNKHNILDIPIDEVKLETTQVINDTDTKISVKQAISALPLELKEVILLRYYRDLSIKDISSIISAPETTVNYRLLKAKSLLKDTLKEDVFDG